jgi:hypothetical protein
VALAAGAATRRSDNHAGDIWFSLRWTPTAAASQLSPMELYLALEAERSEVNELTALLAVESEIANSLSQWSFTIEGAQQGLVDFVRSVQKHEIIVRLQTEDVSVLKGEFDVSFTGLVHEILDNLVRQRESLLEYAPSAIYFIELFEMVGDRLRPLVCFHTPGVVNHKRTWGLQEGPVGSAVAAGAAKHIGDLNVVVDLHQDRRPSDSENIRSTIVAPLSAVDERRHQCHGALFISSSVPDQFTPQHAVFVKILANVLSGMFYARENAHRRVDDVRRQQGHPN